MGLSSSKTKTKSTTTSSPLDQYAPYINQGLSSAQNVLDANQGNLASMSQSAYGLYDDLAKTIGAGGGFIGNAQNIAADIYGGVYRGTNPGAGTYAALQVANDPSMGVLSGLARGSASPGYYDGIGTDNPALPILQGMTSQSNPALGLLAGMTDQSANPDSAQFYKDTLAGKYLNNNPYLDAIVQQGTDAATKAVNRRFAAAGMGDGLSTPYADLLSRNIADTSNQLRYTAYNNELNRMGQVGGQSDAEYNATKDRALQAANGLGSLYNSSADRALSAATSLGSLYNQTGQLDLSAQQAKDQAFNNDRAAQLAAAQALGQQRTADNTTALNAASAADTQHDQQIAQMLQALGLVPELASAQYAGVSPALAALQQAASIPYTGVNNYAALVNGLTGKYGTETTNSTQTTGGLTNFLSSLSGLGSALGGAGDLLKILQAGKPAS